MIDPGATPLPAAPQAPADLPADWSKRRHVLACKNAPTLVIHASVSAALLQIRSIITRALERESASGELRAQLEGRMRELNSKLVLPGERPLDALMAFVEQYVRSVPSCLRLVSAVSRRQGFYDYAAPFLHLAEDYFLRPPDQLVPAAEGLEALLDEAFLAHRLLEEVNDHHLRHLQRPLLPVDMTESNSVVHHLLGDRVATRLEELVQHTAGQLLDREYVWERVRGLPGTADQPLASTERLIGPQYLIRLRLAY